METCVGHVMHYYNHLGVAALSLTCEIKINDLLHFAGHSTDFYQKDWSMEIDHKPIQLACPGMLVALKVAEPVHEGDQVFLVIEASPEERQNILFEQFREWNERT